MARYKEWVHQEVMRLGDPISVKIQFGSWTVSHSLWITDHCPWPNPLRASPEDGFSFNDFKTNLDFRMLPSAVFPGKNFKMGFEVTLKHHFPLYGTKYAVSIEKRSLVDLKLDSQKRQNFWDFYQRIQKIILKPIRNIGIIFCTFWSDIAKNYFSKNFVFFEN